YKRRCYSLILAKSDSLPHAHAQAFKNVIKDLQIQNKIVEIVSPDEEEEIRSFQDKYEHVSQKHKLIKKVKSR
ncbi:hypothetical protein Tco_1047755, partial [Tanacetum coccineum]